MNVEHCTLTNTCTCMQRPSQAQTASQNDRTLRESERARVQRWVLNDLKRELLCVIEDALEILPWQTFNFLWSCILFLSCTSTLALVTTFRLSLDLPVRSNPTIARSFPYMGMSGPRTHFRRQCRRMPLPSNSKASRPSRSRSKSI